MGTLEKIVCPDCGHVTERWNNPAPTVDVIIVIGNKIVLIERKNEPHGWAIPGGFVDLGETVEQCALREMREETNLAVRNLRLFSVQSDPSRDPRQHTISVIFTGEATGHPVAGDDAAKAELFGPDKLPPLVFDHAEVLAHYFAVARLPESMRAIPSITTSPDGSK